MEVEKEESSCSDC
ncbi:hypothetical protein RDI58_009022 [Solanum bulbocastanum]|uniref:Uncharacterized protein n=1 Tax=Solanum bulbocastanum TaxID=147425 RepID=A0AAN8YNQ7_SOLBU